MCFLSGFSGFSSSIKNGRELEKAEIKATIRKKMSFSSVAWEHAVKIVYLVGNFRTNNISIIAIKSLP